MVDAPEKIWIEQDDCPYFYEESELTEVGSPVTGYVRADLYAALEAQLAENVKIKSLEWSEVRQADEEIRYHHVIAESPIGSWSIEWKGWKDCDDRTVFLNGDFVDNGGDDLDRAKAAAQADFERRILSALEATPPAPKVTDAMVDAAERTMAAHYERPLKEWELTALHEALTAAQEAGKP